MWLKVMGSILVIASTSLFGFLMGLEKKNRLRQLRQLKKYFSLLRGEIQYGYTPLPEALENMGKRNKNIFSDFFLEVAKKLKNYEGNSFYSIWSKEIEEKLSHTSLLKVDKQKLIGLGENLGYLGQDMQVKHIDLYMEGLEEEIKMEVSSSKEKIRLYQLLGVLGGIFVTIVMI